MDAELIKAYESLQMEGYCSADEIICDPALRARFLELMQDKGALADEKDLLHQLLYLQKRKLLPRRN